MKNALTVILAGIFLSAMPAVISADEFVHWPKNGHYYKVVYVPEGISWTQAKARAEQEGGYLATITSSRENKFVFNLIDEKRFWQYHKHDRIGIGIIVGIGPWIGGYQEAGAREPDGGWKWVTGEKFDYTKWALHEPTGRWRGKNENRIQYYSTTPNERASTWNDTADGLPDDPYPVYGYVVEKDAP